MRVEPSSSASSTPVGLIERVFGHGEDLGVLQMSARAFVLFFVALLLIRIAGRRSFGRKSGFDMVVVIILGAVLSRAITGASAFWPTIASATVLVLVHRVLGVLSSRSPAFDRVLKGPTWVLFEAGRIDWKAMQRAGMSIADLDEATRRHTNKLDHTQVARIMMESSGELSITDTPDAGIAIKHVRKSDDRGIRSS